MGRVVRLVVELLVIVGAGAMLSTILFLSFGWSQQMVFTFLLYLSVLMLLWTLVTVFGMFFEDVRRHEDEAHYDDIPEIFGEPDEYAGLYDPPAVQHDPPREIDAGHEKMHGRRARR